MKQRLWWLDDEPNSGERLMPLADLIAWFKETAQTFKSAPKSPREGDSHVQDQGQTHRRR